MRAACPVGGERPLTVGEVALVASVFGAAIDPAPVRLRRRRWFPWQPRETVMAPCGHIHFHPGSRAWCEDFSAASLARQGLFIHEMTHVWQTQTHGWWYLPLVRPFSRRYDYVLEPGKPLRDYGIEQQAEIVRHGFVLRRNKALANASDHMQYERLLSEVVMNPKFYIASG